MEMMLANSNANEGHGSSDVIINANSHCNTVNAEDGAIIVFENNYGNSNGHTSLRGKTLRTPQASLPNNGFYAEFKVAWRGWRATRCPSSWTGNCKLRAENDRAATVIC